MYTSNAEHDVAFGALRLVDPALMSATALMPIAPLDLNIEPFAKSWRRQAERAQETP